jgi:hypothetical protein
MPEPSLDCPRVVALVGEGVAAGVARQVWVRLQFEAGGSRHPFDHPGEPPAVVKGDPRSLTKKERRCLALPLEPTQGPELVTVQRMGAGRAVLDPPHVQTDI